jgi:regulator of sigma E protease
MVYFLNMSLSAIFLFLIILLVLVIVHEFGHFIVAKWVGMRVDEFAFGFPPRLYAKKKGETVYAINALPLGGYVSIWGENGEPNDEAKNHPRAFGNRPWWAQMLVLIAGVTMNMALALVIFMGVSYVVVNASPNSPAYKAGIVPGVTLLKVTSNGMNADLSSATSLIAFIGAHNNDSFTISYRKSDGVVDSTTIVSVYGLVPDRKAIGVSVDRIGYVQTSVLEAIKLGADRTYDITLATVDGLTSLVTELGKGQNVLSSLSGPIGIARIVGQTSEYGIAAVLTLVAVLSINLAVFNSLPLPALDGGRIVVVAIEAITRRKIPHKYYSWVNVIGFLALMALLVIVTVHDIWK